jgi:hypothetical protein
VEISIVAVHVRTECGPGSRARIAVRTVLTPIDIHHDGGGKPCFTLRGLGADRGD